MNIDLDELLGDLPRVEARSTFKQDLLDQVPLYAGAAKTRENTPVKSSGIFRVLAPIAMAASLACGVYAGVADVDTITTALSGLGIAVDNTTVASEWSMSVTPYATTLGEL